MFVHYLSFFAQKDDMMARGVGDYKNMDSLTLIKLFSSKTLTEPNLATIAEQEVRSYLNSHFLSCRMLSKMLISPKITDSNDRSRYIVLCLKRYEWLLNFSKELCKIKNVDINDIFNDEYQICKDMVELLPAKINRIHHYGENPTL